MKLVGRSLKGPEVVGRHSRRFASGRETLPEVQKWSETIPAEWNWLGDPPRGLEVVG